MNVCQHVRTEELTKYYGPGKRVFKCADCRHRWAEYTGELEFAEGQIAGLAFVLLTPRDERRKEWTL